MALVAPFYPHFSFPLVEGKQWSGTAIVENRATDTRNAHRCVATVGCARRIRVPAGEFDVLPVRYEADVKSDDGQAQLACAPSKRCTTRRRSDCTCTPIAGRARSDPEREPRDTIGATAAAIDGRDLVRYPGRSGPRGTMRSRQRACLRSGSTGCNWRCVPR